MASTVSWSKGSQDMDNFIKTYLDEDPNIQDFDDIPELDKNTFIIDHEQVCPQFNNGDLSGLYNHHQKFGSVSLSLEVGEHPPIEVPSTNEKFYMASNSELTIHPQNMETLPTEVGLSPLMFNKGWPNLMFESLLPSAISHRDNTSHQSALMMEGSLPASTSSSSSPTSTSKSASSAFSEEESSSEESRKRRQALASRRYRKRQKLKEKELPEQLRELEHVNKKLKEKLDHLKTNKLNLINQLRSLNLTIEELSAVLSIAIM